MGQVTQIRRFAVKSMLGETPNEVQVTTQGVVGDRVHALVDVDTGKIASAKDPRAWGHLFEIRATYVGPPEHGGVIEFTLPGGQRFRSDAPDVAAQLSAAVGRPVRLDAATESPAMYDLVWENTDIAPEAAITGAQSGTDAEGHPVSTVPAAFAAPGTFQDVAPITLLTTASLDAMRAQHPDGDWSPERFRPNFLLELDGESGGAGFVENEWTGRRVAIGDVVVEVSGPAPRCVMTTLAQPGLPRDRAILQTIARHNRIEVGAWGGLWACLGVYATVVQPGSVAVGDAVRLL